MSFFHRKSFQFSIRFSRIWYSCIFILLIQFCVAQEILVSPYLQPGNAPGLNKEEKVIIWQTDDLPGNFKVEYAEGISFRKTKKAKISSVDLNLFDKPSRLYRATLKGLKFDRSYTYRVTLGDSILAEHKFKTRTKKPQTRFAVFGDIGAGNNEQAAIAFQVSLQDPQFALIPGDMAYNNGRELEYRHRFFPYYLSPVASPEKGAPLLNSIPFYMLLGNHDVYSYNLDEYPDGLAYFYYSDLPRNAPVPKLFIEPEGEEKKISEFKQNTTPQYPGISNYSFENGNVHIICLDANYYINPLDPKLVEWIRSEFGKSKAQWKLVSYHHAAFNASPTHFDYQVMRLLSPVLEEVGVDMVLSAHEHNYQRTLPFKFEPAVDETGT
ncbi:MAG TPA: metallophosphoesterase family protein, partial [Gillisia sp.]|nr:metallophosphoesterase family protein [Gillisia sp.]